MQIAQQTFIGSRGGGGSKASILDDEEFFDGFVEEALRRGVFLEQEEDYIKLLEEIQNEIALRNGKPDPISAVEQVIRRRKLKTATPTRAAVSVTSTPERTSTQERISTPSRETTSSRSGDPIGRIAQKLQIEPTDSRIPRLIEAISEAGIKDPEAFLSIKDAAQKSGVAERTLRRYIADGLLTTEKVKGPRGLEHRLYVPALFMIIQERAGAFERPRSSPVEEMGKEIASLCRMIVEQQSRADKRTDRLLEEMRLQSRTIDELRAEQRDSRAQMHGLQEQMIRALMPPKKRPFWQRLFEND